MSKWVTILTFTYPHEAHLAKSVLEAEKIPVFIKDELTTQVNNFYSNAIGGVKLQIPDAELDKAYILLKEGGFIDEEVKVEIVKRSRVTNTNNCPFCKSKQVSKKKDLNPLEIFVGKFLPVFKPTYVCLDCKKQWEYN
jgi:Putative prokaryotic signal transducing protein